MLIDMYEGKIPYDDRYFACLFELDEDDNFEDVSVWGKANPLFVQFPEIMSKLENDFQSAKNDPEKLQLFRTKNLNQWLSADALISYLDFDSWRECEVDEVDFTGREVIVGVDMAKTTDLCGVSIISKDDYGNILLKSKAFLPSEIINQKEITDKIPYSAYIHSNPEWITATSGKFVNQVEIEDYIRSIEDKYKCKIKTIAFDAWNSLHLMSSLSNDYEVVDVKMSYKTFSPSIKKFRELVYDGLVMHEYNPILNFCVGNAITKSDLQENILLDKQKSVNRIDLLVASIIAYSEIMEEEIEDDYGGYIYV